MDDQIRLRELMGHIVEWGEEVASILEGVGRTEFLAERLVRLSTWKCLENVGEAASLILKLDPKLAAAHPALQLHEARAMRNKLSHGYDGVDFELVWVTAQRFVPPMVAAARDFLARSDDDLP